MGKVSVMGFHVHIRHQEILYVPDTGFQNLTVCLVWVGLQATRAMLTNFSRESSEIAQHSKMPVMFV
jgi:hypothetical protein